MVSKYWLVMKSDNGRILRHDTWGVISQSGQAIADCEAMEVLGERLIAEAKALRKLRRKAA